MKPADYRIATDYRITMATSQTALYCAYGALHRGQAPSFYTQYSAPMQAVCSQLRHAPVAFSYSVVVKYLATKLKGTLSI